MASIIVFGGAGYIGSHAAKALSRAGHAVTIFDNLSTGHRSAVRDGTFVEGDLRHRRDLDHLFGQEKFDAVMHFAASCYVGESVEHPGKYYDNNVVGTLNLLEAMRASGTRQAGVFLVLRDLREPGAIAHGQVTSAETGQSVRGDEIRG